MKTNKTTSLTLSIVNNLLTILSETEKACPIRVLVRKGYIKPKYKESRKIGEFLNYVSNFKGNINKAYRDLASQLEIALQKAEVRREISLYQAPKPAPIVTPKRFPITDLLAPTQPSITLFSRLTVVIGHLISLAHETRASKLKMLFEGLSLTEVAEIYNCSRERVRQIKVDFFKKITRECAWHFDLNLKESDIIGKTICSLGEELIGMSQREAVVTFGFQNTPQCRFILQLLKLKLKKKGALHYFRNKSEPINELVA